MLEVRGIDVSIQAVSVLRGVSLTIPSGATAGLIGRNGAGKTTLMRSIMGLAQCQAGTITFDGESLTALPTHLRNARGIGYMPEDRRLVPQLSVEENLLLPAWAAGVKDARERLDRVFSAIPELLRFRPQRALQLSGGQQKLVALGRAMMCGTRLLLLDEPFEGVAPALAQRLVEVIGGLKQQGMTVLLSESDEQHSAGMLDTLFRIDRGAVTDARG